MERFVDSSGDLPLIKAGNDRVLEELVTPSEVPHFVSPGEIITDDIGFMRGHGTYVESQQLCASVAGVLDRVNKLISVKPFRSRYAGEVGDVVVGRIREVGQKRWRVDTFSRQDSVLLLSSVNLPGGELRRRSAKDELLMREYLNEGDLITAEVQAVFADGALSLHTRSLKYGKLPQGAFLKVPPRLIKRCKTHYHSLPCGATVILGNNGYVWIGPLISSESDLSLRDSDAKSKELTEAERETIVRLRNCIITLSEQHILLYDTTVLYAYEECLNYQAKEILNREVQDEIVDKTRKKLLMQIHREDWNDDGAQSYHATTSCIDFSDRERLPAELKDGVEAIASSSKRHKEWKLCNLKFPLLLVYRIDSIKPSGGYKVRNYVAGGGSLDGGLFNSHVHRSTKDNM